jgi:hypothetical protein
VQEDVWRPRLGVISGLVVLVSAIALGVCWLLSWPYLLLLVTTCFLLLGVFHFAYAMWEGVTQTYIRLIDYPYLGLGAFAAFRAVLGQHERDDALRALANFRAAAIGMPTTPDELKQLTSRSIQLIYPGKSRRTSTSHFAIGR